MIRLILAATLGASYGIYGPAFELCDSRPRETGSEEYLDSEKYELRQWDLESPSSIEKLITRMNQIRRDNVALHRNESLAFVPTDNEQLIAYTKRANNEVILTVVNLDPYHVHSGFLDLPLTKLGLAEQETYQVHDLLTDGRYLWKGGRNYVELHPDTLPAHIFRIRQRVRTEQDFDYFM